MMAPDKTFGLLLTVLMQMGKREMGGKVLALHESPALPGAQTGRVIATDNYDIFVPKSTVV